MVDVEKLNAEIQNDVVGKEEPERDSWKLPEWSKLAFMIIVIGSVFVLAYNTGGYSENTKQLQDLNSSLNRLNSDINALHNASQYSFGVLFQGETELARMIQDINARIVLGSNCVQVTQADANGITYWGCKQ